MYSYSLKGNWKSVCNEYLKRFCERHDYAYEPDMWVANEPGTIIEIADMFVTMDNIRYDVDNEVPEEKFAQWYWASVDRHMLDLEDINYQSFCKGAPWRYSDEELANIQRLKSKIDNIVHKMNNKDYKN